VAGTIVFIVSLIFEWFETKFPPKKKPVPIKVRHKREIKADLDVLFRSYQQGLLDEAEYLDQTDELIDQLADLVHETKA
jgi:hypothetical protein